MLKNYAVLQEKTITNQEGSQKMYSSDYVWAKVLSYLEDQLGSVAISAYFDDAQVIELTEDKLILYSPSEFRRGTIVRRYTDYIHDALKSIFDSDAKLEVYGDTELEAYRNKGKDKIATSMDFNPQFSFDNFVVGPSNRFAHGAAMAVTNNPGAVYNPLFIYGPPGIGKTHLLYAIANGIRKNNPDICYSGFTVETLYDTFIQTTPRISFWLDNSNPAICAYVFSEK